ncbi:MAG: FAD-dependent oxidoreductase [Candidatus Omnitrophica bacterium]|nr:FAD-dependent oxidoreductase [Candidatus Omnitrophota bacterium]
MGQGRIVIIGAGPAGLGAAWRLRALGYENFQLYEASDRPGGLCASFTDKEGFTWDQGVHVIAAAGKDFLEFIHRNCPQAGLLPRHRKALVWAFGRWIPYPFQNHIYTFPPGQALESVLGVLKARVASPHENISLQGRIMKAFGEGLGRQFLLPFNRKIWCYPLDQLEADEIMPRVSLLSLGEVFLQICARRAKNDWGLNARFFYPKEHGIGSIFRELAGPLSSKIRYSAEVVGIDTAAKKVFLQDSRSDSYDFLINTMPLDRLLEISGARGAGGKEGSFRYTSLKAVGIGLRLPCAHPWHWAYFSQPKLPFFRVSPVNNFSSRSVPEADTYSAFLCELSYAQGNAPQDGRVADDVIAGLQECGLISSQDRGKVVSVFVKDIPYAYPLAVLGGRPALSGAHRRLESLGIYSRGRFGGWRYAIGNMDDCFRQGQEIAGRLVTGEPETTWRI